jgi:hypothetical protein
VVPDVAVFPVAVLMGAGRLFRAAAC